MAKKDRADDTEETVEAVAPTVAREESDGLVAMRKDEHVLRVHPLTVDAHKKAGWKHA